MGQRRPQALFPVTQWQGKVRPNEVGGATPGIQ